MRVTARAIALGALGVFLFAGGLNQPVPRAAGADDKQITAVLAEADAVTAPGHPSAPAYNIVSIASVGAPREIPSCYLGRPEQTRPASGSSAPLASRTARDSCSRS